MTVRRVVSVSLVGVCLLFAAAAKRSAFAQPPPAPDPAGSDVQPVEDAPPGDIEGRDENPDAPRGTEPVVTVVTAPTKEVRSGYPIEEALRPITLLQGMAEITLDPHMASGIGDDSLVRATAALRARYGITRQIQLGLTYVVGAFYDDPKSAGSDKVAFHPGKALGLDVTYLVKDWIGVRVGVPVWIYRPEAGGAPAIGLTLGAPVKFQFGEKFAIGGLDDLLSIKLTKFAPTFEFEDLNAARAAADDTNTIVSAGFFRISAYGIYQRSPKLALIGRVGITLEDFTATGTQSDAGGGLITMLRAGLNYTPKSYLDVGFSLGFDDLSELGSFGPAGFLAFRI